MGVEGHQMNKKVKNHAVLSTDKNTSYHNIKHHFDHEMKLSEEHSKVESLKLVHIGISNAKRKLIGINYNIKHEYHQNYLNEYCFKINRRKDNYAVTFI